MKAEDIISLLGIKHKKDVFVSECKDGPSCSGYLKLDAWAMKKSWAHPLVIGYEIKVSRNDFLGDEKWRGYLDYCNEFYFVCPADVIKPEELPDDTGLLYVASTGTRLYTKKKAKYRDVQIPDCIYRYILMARARITPSRFYAIDGVCKREFWRNWLRQKQQDLDLGHRVSKRLRELIDEKIEAVQRENKRLTEKMKEYDELKKLIAAMGFDPDQSSWLKYEVEQYLEKLRGVLPHDIERSLDNNIEYLQKLKEKLQNLKSGVAVANVDAG